MEIRLFFFSYHKTRFFRHRERYIRKKSIFFKINDEINIPSAKYPNLERQKHHIYQNEILLHALSKVMYAVAGNKEYFRWPNIIIYNVAFSNNLSLQVYIIIFMLSS